ncbi:MAG: (2Fe-2S)-binding protein [Candidatus Hadarchaeum sp.]|uniref:(2Fe-2S)-binding protein n=1 Tax=Candidatus Hadarchaeum sp. TaxID=2883567 RepID=UPI003177FEC0
MKKYPLEFKVNGKKYSVEVKPNMTLLRLLRSLGFTEVKSGCEKGDCGTCAVLMDGEPVNSCLTLALQAQGKEITTVKGLGTMEKLHPIQEAFVKYGAIQCGFCTPGMVITAKAFLDKNPNPTREEIREAISGNLCRCTGYQKIVDAIEAAAKKMKEAR